MKLFSFGRRKEEMKHRLLFSLTAGLLISLTGFRDTHEHTPAKSSVRAAHHCRLPADDYGELKVVFADRYRSRNWESLYGMFEEAGARVYFSDRTDFDVNDYDALVLGGGYDIDPSLYGEENRGSEDIDKEEDILQLKVAQKFAEAGKPVLGICRGAQLINVYFGGTLNQDIGGHKGTERTIRVREDSLFSRVLTEGEKVVCWHHQSVKQPGDDLVVTMYDGDDLTVEGFEHAYLPVYGIQWHPEASSCGEKIIRTFLEEVSKRKKQETVRAGERK